MGKHSTKAAGIDTGKHKLDVALSSGDDILQIGNDEAGYQELCSWLRRHRVKRVGIEASGGYERGVWGGCGRMALSSSCCSRCRFAPMRVIV